MARAVAGGGRQRAAAGATLRDRTGHTAVTGIDTTKD